MSACAHTEDPLAERRYPTGQFDVTHNYNARGYLQEIKGR